MAKNPNARKPRSNGARRALALYASDTAYRFALRLAILLCLTVLCLRCVLR